MVYLGESPVRALKVSIKINEKKSNRFWNLLEASYEELESELYALF